MEFDFHSQYIRDLSDYNMNAKFFDLKKEKQDRMINAALKIFAENGYSHASTDDIVKEARISKGLLFHYFESKIGVYSFLCDYSVKYYSLELSSAIDPEETDFFALKKQVEAAKMQTLKTHPYMFFFMNGRKTENSPEALIATEESMAQYSEMMDEIFAKADMVPIKSNALADKYLTMLDKTLDALMEEHLRDGSFNAENQYSENISYIGIVEKLF